MVQTLSCAVYVINLERSADRLARVKKQLTKLDLSWQRVEAVDGKQLTSEQWSKVDQARYLRAHGKKPTAGEVGCYLSHLRALETFLASDHTHALILEDDITPPDALPGLLQTLLTCAEDWDMVHLSGHRGACPIEIAKLDVSYHMALYLGRQTGSGAYLVNRFAAKQLLDHLLPMMLPYDHAFNQAWRFCIKQRGIVPLPINQSSAFVNASTIDQDAINAGRLPWWQKLPTMWYRAKVEVATFCHGFMQLARIKQVGHKSSGIKR